MSEDITLEDYKKAYREVEIEEGRRSFLAHLITYVLVNTMLIVINLMFSPNKLWFFYPLIGWGIGVLTHYLYGVRWIEKILEKKEAMAEYRAKSLKKNQKS